MLGTAGQVEPGEDSGGGVGQDGHSIVPEGLSCASSRIHSFQVLSPKKARIKGRRYWGLDFVSRKRSTL